MCASFLSDLPAQCRVNARMRGRATDHDLSSSIPDKKKQTEKKTGGERRVEN